MKKLYRVIGDSIVAGHGKDEEFDFDSDDWFEQALIDGGHIEVVEEYPDDEEVPEE